MADAAFPTEISPEQEARDRDAARAQASANRRKWLFRVALIVVIALVVWLLWYVLFGRNYTSSDDAYVNAQTAQITPLVSAPALDVPVKETQMVHRGDVLVRLDPATAMVNLAAAQADLAQARRKFRQTLASNDALDAQIRGGSAEIASARAQQASQQANLDKAQIDLSRREALAASGGVSGEELTSARQSYAAAVAGVRAAAAGVIQAQSQRRVAQGQFAANNALVRGNDEESDPGVLTAKSRLAAAQLDVDRTVLRAPMDGVVTRLSVQIGQQVAVGTPMMMVVPVDQVYVDANFKEAQLRRVRVGMPARVTVDLYGSGVVYHGHVAGFSGGTGSSLALIPAQNATGNWIKVVQRVPVRIELDPRELRRHPLRVGLSCEVTIDLTSN